MPTADERGHLIPNATGEAPSRAGIFGVFKSVNDVILCDDAGDRAAKIAALSYTPDATRPALFWRADAPAGRQLEVWDGATLYVYDARDTGMDDISSDFGGGGTRSASIQRVGDRVFIEVNVQRGTLSSGDVFATLDAEFRPASPVRDSAVSSAGGGTIVQVQLDDATGELRFYSSGLTNSGHYVGWTASWTAAS